VLTFCLPFVKLQHSPLAGGPAEIHYRQFGSGRPLIFLHGGWGYQIYPLSEQRVSIPGVQVIIPDRSGYGRSTKPSIFNAGFHRLAVGETLAFMDALNLDRPMLWGHSDGAVIAAWMAVMAPQRCRGIMLEALHYYRVKPRSLEFFRTLARDQDGLGERVISILAADHGPQWRDPIRGDCEAWLEIAALNSSHPDLYEGRLSEIKTPVALLHGENDPRTEPDELDRVRRELPAAQPHIIPGAGHSPHSERGAQEEVARRVREVVMSWK
jgi:pimeloyl-ACP methyl ester carboxylesterase